MSRVWTSDATTTADPEGPTPGGAGVIIWTGMAVVLAAAAVLSFSALRDLAITVRIASHLAWLLPVCVDAGAAVSTTVWLSGRANEAASGFARWLTWALLVLTVAGNATHQGLAAADVIPPWWVAVLVGAIAPVVVGSVVHLAVLVGRTQLADDTTAEPIVVEAAVVAEPAVEKPAADKDGGDLIARAAELVADGAGRPRLRRELGVSDYRAKQLLGAVTNGSAS